MAHGKRERKLAANKELKARARAHNERMKQATRERAKTGKSGVRRATVDTSGRRENPAPGSGISRSNPRRVLTQRPELSQSRELQSNAVQSPFVPSVATDTSSPSTPITTSEGAKGFLQQGFDNLKEDFERQLAGEPLLDENGQPIAGSAPSVAVNIGSTAAIAGAGKAFQWINNLRKGKDSIGTLSISHKALNVAKNTKNVKASNTLLSRIMQQMKKPSFVAGAIGGMIGTYPWAEWALGEAKEGMIFNMHNALSTGDPELIQEYMRVSDEIFDITIWESVQRMIPGANIAFGFREKAKALAMQKKVNDAVAMIEIDAINNGESDDEKWARIQAEQDARREQQRRDDEAYYAEINRQRAEAKAAERKADEEYYQRILDRRAEDEAARRKANEEYWAQVRQASLEYQRTKNAISPATPYQREEPSALSFGLLR